MAETIFLFCNIVAAFVFVWTAFLLWFVVNAFPRVLIFCPTALGLFIVFI